VVSKADFSVVVIQGLFDLAMNDSLLPCQSITGGRNDWAVDDKFMQIQIVQIMNRIFFKFSIFLF
jgi:hypothetical protein